MGRPLKIFFSGIGGSGVSATAGSLVADALAKRFGADFKRHVALHGDVASGSVGEERVFLLKPRTVMNRSGMAVRAALDFYKLAPSDVLVICDDADLPFGNIRFKQKGSSGGHNGMHSIIEHLGTSEFARLRIGIGRPDNDNVPLEDWVPGLFTKDEQGALADAVERAADEAETWIG